MKQARNPLLVVALFLSVAVTTAQDRTPPRVPGIDVSGMDVSVRPQDDFFRYVNGKWADDTPIPGDLVQLRHVRDAPRARQEAIREHHRGRSPIAGGARLEQPEGRRPLQELHGRGEARVAWASRRSTSELAQIAAIKDRSELPAAFARAARVGVRLPFAVSVGTDQRNSDAYAVQIAQSGLGMPDRDYYLRNDGKFAATRKAYSTYISRLFALGNQPDPEGAAARIISLETKSRQLQWDRARNRDRNATYNKMGVASLQASMPNFDWQAYLSALPAGAKAHSHRGHRPAARLPEGVSTPSLREIPVATWKEYLTFGLISEYAGGLSTPFADTQFEFTGKVLERTPGTATRAGSAASPRSSKRSANRLDGSTSKSISSRKPRRAWTH